MSENVRFYEQLDTISHIGDITNPAVYTNMPSDWYIAISDVQGSTQAILDGRYKDVNGIAAASICALLNSLTGVDIPFVFGGDGATVVIPPEMLEEARQSLIATQRLAKSQFNLNLRVGIVPITDVERAGYKVRVAKLRYHEHFQQAVFTGGGIACADRMIKDPATAPLYLVKDDGQTHEADFTGYECRWSEIPSNYDETVSLMIMATSPDDSENYAVYAEVIQRLEVIYGDSARRNPISFQHMRPALNPSKYGVETRIRSSTSALMARLRLMMWSVGGWLLWTYRDKIWDRYKRIVIDTTDREKFDDTLRMIIAGTVLQRDELEAFLERLRQEGKLVYGMHVSRHALMTCLVFDRFGRQVHFVDGGNGGYAMAAKHMKEQLKRLSTVPQL